MQSIPLNQRLSEVQATIYFDKNQFLRDKTTNLTLLQEVILEAKYLLESAEENEFIFLYGVIGNLYRISEQPEIAVTYLEKALQLTQRYGQKKQQVIALIRLGEAWKYAENHKKALALFQSAASICQSNRLENYLDFVLQHEGKCYLELGAYLEAEQCFIEALVLRRQKKNSDLIFSTESALQLLEALTSQERKED